MRTIDIHAHLVPRSLAGSRRRPTDWYGYRHEPGDGLGAVVGTAGAPVHSPKVRFTPEERIQDMDAQGVDVQVVSIHTPFFGYHLDAAQGQRAGARRQRRDRGDDAPVADALCGSGHAAGAGRGGGDRGAGASRDRAGLEGGRARHHGERRELGRAASSCHCSRLPSRWARCSSSIRSRSTTS